jgi:hypothetical protein
LTTIKRFDNKYNESIAELGKYRQELEVTEAAYHVARRQVNFHEQLAQDLFKVAEEQASVNSRLEKDHEVSLVCLAAMKHIMQCHLFSPQMLPYANVLTADNKDKLAEAFGVHDYASTDLSTRNHFGIARGLKFLGFEFSPANNKRMLDERILKANKGTTKEEMRAQTCSCLGIIKPTPAVDTKSRKKRSHRKGEVQKSPKRRKINSDEVIILLASNPVLQAAVVRQMTATTAVAPATDQQPTDDKQDQKPAAYANGPK